MPEQFDYFFWFVKNAKHNMLYFKDSTLYFFIGKRRSGKSTSALAMCKAIDPDFDTEQIVFTNDEFRRLTKVLRGRAILWDEASVTAYSRDYAEKVNKDLNKLFQVYGYRRLAVCMTFQHLGFIDKHTRTIADSVFEVFYKRRIQNGLPLQETFLRPLAVVTNWILDPVLTPYKINENGRYREIGVIPLPQEEELFKKVGVSKKLVKDYEKKKEEFFEELGEPETEREERLQLDKRHLRRFEDYEYSLFSLIEYLITDLKYPRRKVALYCDTTDQRLDYWLKHPLFEKTRNKFRISSLNVEKEATAEFEK